MGYYKECDCIDNTKCWEGKRKSPGKCINYVNTSEDDKVAYVPPSPQIINFKSIQ